MVARGHRQEAVLIAVALIGLLACGRAGQGRTEQVTPWLAVEHLDPWLEVPHVLKLGPEERVVALSGDVCRRIYEGPSCGAIALAGGAAVVLRARGEIHARDGSVAKLPAAACPRAWQRHVAIVRELDRVICMKVEAEDGGCARIQVAQFDATGRLLRADALGTGAVCARTREAPGGGGTYLLAGVTGDGDPVVAVRASSHGARPEFAVAILGPGGVREAGRFTMTDEKAALWAVNVASHVPGIALTKLSW
jgi:hypothetical protein